MVPLNPASCCWFPCVYPHCSELFTYPGPLYEHLFTCPLNGGKLVCPYCHRDFGSDPVALVTHVRHHAEYRSYVCPFRNCRTLFRATTKQQLRAHLQRIHEKEMTKELWAMIGRMNKPHNTILQQTQMTQMRSNQSNHSNSKDATESATETDTQSPHSPAPSSCNESQRKRRRLKSKKVLPLSGSCSPPVNASAPTRTQAQAPVLLSIPQLPVKIPKERAPCVPIIEKWFIGDMASRNDPQQMGQIMVIERGINGRWIIKEIQTTMLQQRDAPSNRIVSM